MCFKHVLKTKILPPKTLKPGYGPAGQSGDLSIEAKYNPVNQGLYRKC